MGFNHTARRLYAVVRVPNKVFCELVYYSNPFALWNMLKLILTQIFSQKIQYCYDKRQSKIQNNSLKYI